MAINSIIGAYYYIRVIVVMYMRDASAETAAAAPARFPLAVNFVLAITALGTIYLGLLPSRTLDFLLRPNLLGH
jgi:NADH-quinone oxidoreductase subunit N